MQDFYTEGFPEWVVCFIIKQVLKAVEYLHENHFIHNNIRTENIFLDTSGSVKLAGLNQMIQMVHGGQVRRSICKFVGNTEYMAPEVLSQVPISPFFILLLLGNNF